MELEHNLINTSCEDSKDDSSFSEDLLMEIFRRLPPKSLFRFKCVSKVWESLISVESFQTRLLLSMSGLFYSVRVSNNLGHSELREDNYCCLSDEKSDDGINLSFLTSHLKFRIIDSCSGLLLCLYTEGRRVISFVVCNPLTRRWASLPKPTKRCSLDDARLIFDYQSSPHFQVVIVSGPSDSYIKLHSFSSETGKWIESEVHCEFVKYSMRAKDGVYSNGTLYMYAYILPCRRVVVGINLKEESCRIIELPEDCYGVLGKNSGHLYYITHNMHQLQIWMLKEDSTSDWVSKHNITVEALGARASLPACRRSFRDYQSYHPFHPLAFHPDLEVVFLRTHCKTFSYNFRSMRLEKLWGFSSCSPSITNLDTSTYIYTFSVFPYTPCLNPSSIN